MATPQGTGSNRLLTITITNNSGIQQSYALFAGEPTIQPSVKPIHNDIITVFKGVAGGGGGQAFFTIPHAQLYAICGTSNRDAIEDGVQLEIVDKQLITLGHTTDEGKLVAGTTCNVSVENGTPVFNRHAAVGPLGNPGCFCIRTSTDFSYKEAKVGMYLMSPFSATSLVISSALYSLTVTSHKAKPSDYIQYLILSACRSLRAWIWRLNNPTDSERRRAIYHVLSRTKHCLSDSAIKCFLCCRRSVQSSRGNSRRP